MPSEHLSMILSRFYVLLYTYTINSVFTCVVVCEHANRELSTFATAKIYVHFSYLCVSQYRPEYRKILINAFVQRD